MLLLLLLSLLLLVVGTTVGYDVGEGNGSSIFRRR